MVTIDLLQHHQEHIPQLARMWREELGKIWLPDLSTEYIEEVMASWNNADKLPLAYVAVKDGKLVGIASLQENCGIMPDLSPWLGSLIVERAHQKQGIGQMLCEATKQKARELGFDKLYLFTFESALCHYYKGLGWAIIGQDEFQGRPVTIMKLNIGTSP